MVEITGQVLEGKKIMRGLDVVVRDSKGGIITLQLDNVAFEKFATDGMFSSSDKRLANSNPGAYMQLFIERLKGKDVQINIE